MPNKHGAVRLVGRGCTPRSCLSNMDEGSIGICRTLYSYCHACDNIKTFNATSLTAANIHIVDLLAE